jgi:hypothetical protein
MDATPSAHEALTVSSSERQVRVHRLIAHFRSNLVGWVALFVALGGTGYAATSHSHSNTVNACANKKTGELSVRHGARCKRGQVKLSWAKQGPKGPAGTSAIQAFGAVGASGIVIPNGGITVQHSGPGVYVVTATSAGCAKGLNDPTVTATDGGGSTGIVPAGAVQTAWIDTSAGGGATFTVHTGWISGGSFTSADFGFDLQDSCVPSGGGG